MAPEVTFCSQNTVCTAFVSSSLLYRITSVFCNCSIYFLLLCLAVFEEVCRYLREECVAEYVFILLFVLFHLFFKVPSSSGIRSAGRHVITSGLSPSTFLTTSGLNGLTVAPYFPLRMSFVSFVAICSVRPSGH